tara:strand:- start:165 stop:515 length:351 start_codon:yes stop_codon:yes gene_type:complete
MPKLNNKSQPYLFKNRLRTRRKTNEILLRESLYMSLFALLLLFLNYQIPNKILLIKRFNNNLNNIFSGLFDIFKNFYEILLVLFLVLSTIFILILLIGSLNRTLKVIYKRRKKMYF